MLYKLYYKSRNGNLVRVFPTRHAEERFCKRYKLVNGDIKSRTWQEELEKSFSKAKKVRKTMTMGRGGKLRNVGKDENTQYFRNDADGLEYVVKQNILVTVMVIPQMDTLNSK